MMYSQRTACPAGRLVFLFGLVLALVMALIVGTSAGCSPRPAHAAILQLASSSASATDRTSSSASSSDSASSASPDVPVEWHPDHFMSHGKKIEVIRARPKQEGKYPAVLWLPGIDGINKDNREALTGVINRLAQKGYVVHMVCYTDCFAGKEGELDHFKVRAQSYLVPPKGSGSASDSEDSKRMADAWQDCIITIDDGIKNVRRDPLTDKERVGIVGMSLGSATGMVLASRPENGIKAFICMSGCVPAHVDMKATARTLPPLKIFHGKLDPIIPVQMAEDLFDAMPKEARDIGTHKKTIFDKGGHLFIDPQTKKFQLGDALIAEMEGAEFLKEHLQDKTEKPLK